MILGRLFGWVVVLVGMMVVVRDALVWLDTGRLLPLSLAEAWSLVGYFGRFRAAAMAGPASALWAGAVLLALGAALLVLCRRPTARRRFRNRPF